MLGREDKKKKPTAAQQNTRSLHTAPSPPWQGGFGAARPLPGQAPGHVVALGVPIKGSPQPLRAPPEPRHAQHLAGDHSSIPRGARSTVGADHAPPRRDKALSEGPLPSPTLCPADEVREGGRPAETLKELQPSTKTPTEGLGAKRAARCTQPSKTHLLPLRKREVAIPGWESACSSHRFEQQSCTGWGVCSPPPR